MDKYSFTMEFDYNNQPYTVRIRHHDSAKAEKVKVGRRMYTAFLIYLSDEKSNSRILEMFTGEDGKWQTFSHKIISPELVELIGEKINAHFANSSSEKKGGYTGF